MLKTLDFCKKSIPYGGKILDLAAAQGNFSLSLAEMGYEVTWNDLRDELADYVRLKQEKGTIHFVPGNIFKLPFKKEFDAVILCEVIEHVAHPDELLKVAASFLKDGGYMILSTPNADYCVSNLPSYRVGMDTTQLESLQFRPNSDGHLFLFDKSGLESLAKEAGLQEGRLIGFPADTHIYVNHVEGAKEQLTRDPDKYALPKLVTEPFTSIFDWHCEDSTLQNYEAYPTIKFQIAV